MAGTGKIGDITLSGQSGSDDYLRPKRSAYYDSGQYLERNFSQIAVHRRLDECRDDRVGWSPT